MKTYYTHSIPIIIPHELEIHFENDNGFIFFMMCIKNNIIL